MTGFQKYSKEQIAAARKNVSSAFSAAGLVTKSGHAICPACQTGTKGKVKLFEDGGWYCNKCAAHGDAIGVLMDTGLNFVSAVGVLLGDVTVETQSSVTPVVSESFAAVVDSEVYEFVTSYGSVSAAQEFYAEFGIAPEVVAASGASYIVSPEALTGELRARFGDERLIACGLASPPEGSAKYLRLLVNGDYPVVEPHRNSEGRVVGMQFRASREQAEKFAAHKRGEGPYVPKFLSLRGAGKGHLLGCGLHELSFAEDNAVVHIVEGFKDLLAARTLGWNAYALPGAGTTPPESSLSALSRFRIQVTLDGDDAGAAGATAIHSVFVACGITAGIRKLPDGLDVADLLASTLSR